MTNWVVGIDGNEANVAQRVGSNVYAFELLRAMYVYLSKHPLFSVVVYLQHPPLSDWPEATEWWKYEVVPTAPLWSQWRLPLEVAKKKACDLLFSPGHYLPVVATVPMVATIMDLAYEMYPEHFKVQDLWKLRLWTRRSVQQAKHLFAISEATKRDLVTIYKQKPDHITVAYPAVEPPKQSNSSAWLPLREKLGIRGSYFVFVGTIQPRKNIVRLVEAFEAVRRAGHECQLVLAGKAGWLSESIMDRIQQSTFSSDIIHTGFVTDEEKNLLIENALALALVGLYEGFGIPPLEAIHLGTLPVVSGTSSLPEVVGEGAILVDPLRVTDIAAGLTQALVMSSDERAERLKQLKSHAAKFSWDDSAAIVTEKLASLLVQGKSL